MAFFNNVTADKVHMGDMRCNPHTPADSMQIEKHRIHTVIDEAGAAGGGGGGEGSHCPETSKQLLRMV